MVTPFYPPHIGGIEYHVENLVKCLSRKNHKLTVLTSALSPDDSYFTKIAKNIDVIRLKTFFPFGWVYPSLSSQGLILNLSQVITQLVKQKKISIIHVHGHHYYLSWKAISMAKKLRIPSVLTLHGLYALAPENKAAMFVENFFNVTIFRRELKQVTAVIGLTSVITDYAKKYSSDSQLHFTIPSGVKSQIFNSNRNNRLVYRKKYEISDDKIIILFSGRFVSIKGVLELALAVRYVVKKIDNVLFLFFGGGPLIQELTEILKPVKKNSKIINWTSVDEIFERYVASDFFVLPSKSEALPLTILEAMAANLHIISTRVGGIPDVLEAYCQKTFIKKVNAHDIAEAILIAVQKKKGMSKNNNDATVKNFNWENVASKIESVYQNLLT